MSVIKGLAGLVVMRSFLLLLFIRSVVEVKLVQSLHPFSSQKSDMRLHFLKNVSVTCNDGSPAGYYIKESKGSKRWLLFLEGGWFCVSKHICDYRFKTKRKLMGSGTWPQTTRGRGILSPQPEENPHWWNANMVLLPYCSSDVWSGTRPKTKDSGYAFMGSLIVKEVVNELLTKGLEKAEILLLAGSSAGGLGVLVNVDRVAEKLESQGHHGVRVRGLTDSGWVLERKQYKFGDCLDVLSCGPIDSARMAVRQWGTIMPEICRRAHLGEEWQCFFGYKLYPTLKSPLFVMEWLYDQAQLMVFNATLNGQPVIEGQWVYLQTFGEEMRSSLHQVKATFAPACLAHDLIASDSWLSVQVRGTSLSTSLHCWDQSLRDNHINNYEYPNPKTQSVKDCPLHVIDSCSWPQCNPTCPSIHDERTGEEITVIQYMGLDVSKNAQQQGLENRISEAILKGT